MGLDKGQKRQSEDKITYAVKFIMPAVVLVIIITVLSIFTAWQKKTVASNADSVMENMSRNMALNMKVLVNYAESSIKSVATTVSHAMTSEVIDRPAELILPLVDNTPFQSIEYIRADGMNVMNVGDPFDASDREYYRQGIKGYSGYWINYNPKKAKDVLINFYTPLIYNDKIVGVLTGYIAAKAQISPNIEGDFFGQDIITLLLDESQTVICANDKMSYAMGMNLNQFMDSFHTKEGNKKKAIDAVKMVRNGVFTYKNDDGEGRVSISEIQNTGWKIMVVIPTKSFEESVEISTKNAIIAFTVVVGVLVIYLGCVIRMDRVRRKRLAAENAKLEEINRHKEEENSKAFEKLKEINDIIFSANMGVWKIELTDGQEPRMYVDKKMRELLGVSDADRSPEQTYNDWYDNIAPDALDSVAKSVERMKDEGFDENTYLWIHPTKGLRYVRCGGASIATEAGYVLRGYHYDVDELVRKEQAQLYMLKEALADKNEYYTTLGALGDVFYSMHVIDLQDDKVTTFSAKEYVAAIVNGENGARRMMKEVMESLTTLECRQEALAFSDLDTVADRMQNKVYMEKELKGIHLGWFKATFIVMEKDEEGRPTKVIYATRNIDEEKRQEERLIYKSQTDELTKLLNRRAYEEALLELEENGIPEDFVYVAFDLNGLKVANDTIGHEAGDEIIRGGAWCINAAMGGKGRAFRTGGDEFVAMLNADKQQLKDMEEVFKDNLANWRGKLVNGISISYGYVTRAENPNASIREISQLADSRLYEAKTQYYRKAGVDRRGRKDAHIALISQYIKILKINVTDDTYQIIDLKQGEPVEGAREYATISQWFMEFGKKGFVHPDDLYEFYAKTDLQYLRNYFAEHAGSMKLLYRRKYEDDFRLASIEILKANDYTNDNQSLYLYVKNEEE